MLANTIELHEVIYRLLAAQIEFGAYRCGDSLPKIEETGRWLSVSLDTVRSAYRRLRQKGYIKLSKRAGAAVVVQYHQQEIERHIQTFFSIRRDAAIDLCRSMGPLFCKAQWFALKNAGSDRLDEMERLCMQRDIPSIYIMPRHLQLIYSPLGNDLLLRLVWHAFMFFQAPFLTLPQNRAPFEDSDGCLIHMITLCRRKDWDGLWNAVTEFQAQLSEVICRFYEEKITMEPAGQQLPFLWNAYKKSSQRCYSLAMELLIGISRSCMQGGLLPSPACIAREKKVSVSTVRRTLALLNQLGATQSINGVGTQVLNTGSSMENCDFSQPIIRKRLLDFVQSLHILALTCKSCAEITFASMDPLQFRQCQEKILELKCIGRHETVVFDTLGFISQMNPVRAIREIYTQLQQMLLWGYPLRGIHGEREAVNQFYLPYIDTIAEYLDRCDGTGLAAKLEQLVFHELRFAIGQLNGLGICAASSLILPKS